MCLNTSLKRSFFQLMIIQVCQTPVPKDHILYICRFSPTLLFIHTHHIIMNFPSSLFPLCLMS